MTLLQGGGDPAWPRRPLQTAPPLQGQTVGGQACWWAGRGPLHEVTRGPRLVGWWGHSSALHVVSMWRLTSSPRWGRDREDWEGVYTGQTEGQAASVSAHISLPEPGAGIPATFVLLWTDLLSGSYPCPWPGGGLRGLHQRAPSSCASGGCRGRECGQAPPAPSCLAAAMVGSVPEQQGRFLSPPSPTVLPPSCVLLLPMSVQAPGRQLPALLAGKPHPHLFALHPAPSP